MHSYLVNVYTFIHIHAKPPAFLWILKSTGTTVESITKPYQTALSWSPRFSFEIRLMAQPHEANPEGGRSFPCVPLDFVHISPLPDVLPVSFSCIEHSLASSSPCFLRCKGPKVKGRNVRQVSAEDLSAFIVLCFPFLCLYSCVELDQHFGMVAVVHLQLSFIAAISSPWVSALPSQCSSKALPVFFVILFIVFFPGVNRGAGSTSRDLSSSVAMKE